MSTSTGGFDHVLGYWYDIIETRNGEETRLLKNGTQVWVEVEARC